MTGNATDTLVAMDPDTMDMEFVGELRNWRGPAPFHFITVPEEACIELRAVSAVVSYGWGMIPGQSPDRGKRVGNLAVSQGRRLCRAHQGRRPQC